MTWRTKGTYLADQDDSRRSPRGWNAVFGGFAVLSVLLTIAIAIVAPRLSADGGVDQSPPRDVGRIVLGEDAIDIATALDNPSLTPPDLRAAFPGDRGEVLSLFSSGVNAPFGASSPFFDEGSDS